MAIQQLTNFKRMLWAFRTDLLKKVDKIDSLLQEIDKIADSRGSRCPKCLSLDLRHMRKGRIFCRKCGYESPKESD